MYGVAVLCGIGFIMSLFIGSLAFAEGGAGYARADRFAIILASALSGVVGYLILRFATKRPAGRIIAVAGGTLRRSTCNF